jgi:beta-aspartyl-peptidase (threonine type)
MTEFVLPWLYLAQQQQRGGATPVGKPVPAGALNQRKDQSMTTPVIAIHGGAGTITRASLTAEDEARYHQALADIVAAGQAVLNAGGSALEAVTEAVRLLEDCPLFNAGHGAVYTSEGRHELDACVMNGADLASGAVACVTNLRNPVLAARAVMEKSEHVLLVGPAAEAFAARNGVATVTRYFHTDARHEQWLRVPAARHAGP